MINLAKLHKNKNFLNSQNYIFGIEKNNSKNKFLFKNQLLEVVNEQYKNYNIYNFSILFFYKILFFFGIYKFNFNKIKGVYWLINDVFIFNAKSLYQELHKFGITDITTLILLDNEKIMNKYSGEEGNEGIISENFLFKITYYKSMNLNLFLNYLGKTEIENYDYELLINNKINYLKFFIKICIIGFIIYTINYFILSSSENSILAGFGLLFIIFISIFVGFFYLIININFKK